MKSTAACHTRRKYAYYCANTTLATQVHQHVRVRSLAMCVKIQWRVTFAATLALVCVVITHAAAPSLRRDHATVA
jgi:hypothetical protein